MEDINWMPTLYKFDNDGSIRQWRVGTTDDMYVVEHGKACLKNGKKGKLQLSKKPIKGNNREPDAAKQAINKAKSMWEEKQRKDTYRPHHEVPTCTAEEWAELHGQTHKWAACCKDWKNATDSEKICTEDYPWIAQYKVDGNRCTAWYQNDEVKLFSRAGLEMEFKEHIRQQLAELFPLINFALTKDKTAYANYDFGIDGEIWTFNLNGFHQDSHSVASRTVNRHKDEESQFYAWYDILNYELDAEHRLAVIDKVSKIINKYVPGANPIYQFDETKIMTKYQMSAGGLYKNIFIMPSKKFTSIEDVMEAYDRARDIGFEGLVLRRANQMYPKGREVKHANMMKMKPHEDCEFEVVGYKSAEGVREGCVVWKLLNNDGSNKTFDCQQMGSLEFQRELFQNAEKYIGKRLTVQITERSKDGTPKQHRALRFRTDDDLVPEDDN